MGRVVRTLKHGWNVFKNPPEPGFAAGPSMPVNRRQRSSARYFNDRSIIGSIYTRLAVDFASVEFFHARLGEDGVPLEVIQGDLQERLTLDANIDQNAFSFKVDLAFSMFEEGVIAVVLTEASLDPSVSTSYKIDAWRVGRIVGWHPRRVTVEVYDDRETDDDGEPVNGGIVKQITLPKEQVAIIENPFYSVMNEPSGTLQRLIRKLAILDSMDEAAGSGKLDLILQLPYAVRGTNRQKQAAERRSDLRQQLKDDELGIGYIDISEKVIQLNRQVDNKLLAQIEYLYNQLYAQLGLTPEIMNGTADRNTINNYFDRTIEPMGTTVALEFKRKFLTKTARTQKQSIEIYRDPLKLIPLDQLAEVADKLLRNAAITANEFRPKIGYLPSKDPAANQLRNPNMPMDDQVPSEPSNQEVDNE